MMIKILSGETGSRYAVAPLKLQDNGRVYFNSEQELWGTSMVGAVKALIKIAKQQKENGVAKPKWQIGYFEYQSPPHLHFLTAYATNIKKKENN